MSVPRATYRLQFRQGMTFARAATLAPYWRDLGISHLYASPLFTAAEGSTHGYDVTDPTALDPALGGEPGFRAMVAALKAEGLGLILDFVPNHMAASTESPWWRDVLHFGSKSAYAGHFDIDWARGPLTLPFLGEPFEAAARNGTLKLMHAPAGHVLRYGGADYPLNAEGTALIDEALHAGTTLDALNRDAEFLTRLHEAQHWRLMEWRAGAQSLTYRRFFEITGLVGLRVEEANVFADVHRKLFSLIDEGLVDGLRLDHIDGLADPLAYLRRLRECVGQRVFIVVEKILESDENLPPDWPVEGTTGYEFIADLGLVLTSSEHAVALDQAYRTYTGDETPYREQADEAKTEVVAHNLTAERTALVTLAARACVAAWPEEARTEQELSPAVAAMMANIPVYRTYVSVDGPSANDRSVLAEAMRCTSVTLPLHRGVVERIGKLLALDVPAEARTAALAFTRRFQQTSGAVMAKGIEDTVFYRFNRLIALNEVGGNPSLIGGSAKAWHAAMRKRQKHALHGLSTTATHDTKRGEDARCRIYAISEAPILWHSLVERLSGMLHAPAIDAQTRWMMFQALLGMWPFQFHEDRGMLDGLAQRLSAFAEKAVREAKRHTSWIDPDRSYEERVRGFAQAIFADVNASFRAEFARVIMPFVRAGAVNSMTQTLLKLTAPGLPDIYQGTEAWDLSLVDPDNRRTVNFADILSTKDDLSSATRALASWSNDAFKAHVLRRALEARRRNPAPFLEGTYVPLSVTGPAAEHIIAFARLHASGNVAVIVPRCVFGRVSQAGPLALDRDWLSSTFVHLGAIHAPALRNELGEEIINTNSLAVDRALSVMPVSLMVT